MTSTTVAEFASELNNSTETLLEQLKSAGVVTNLTASDNLDDADRQRLLTYLQSTHGTAGSERKKIVLVKKTGSTGKARTIQVEVRKKRTFVHREVGEVPVEAVKGISPITGLEERRRTAEAEAAAIRSMMLKGAKNAWAQNPAALNPKVKAVKLDAARVLDGAEKAERRTPSNLDLVEQPAMNTKTVSDVASELDMSLEEVIGHMERVGVRGTTASTQLNNDELQNLMNLVRPWDKILSHVLSPDANAAPFIIEKRDGAIVLSKEWDPQYKAAVWTKTYQPKSAETTGDLSFLCEWENALLTRANQNGVKRCVHLIETAYKPSPMHLPDTPENKREHRSSRLRTFDAGPTLDVWRLMRPRVDGRAQAHPFVQQRNYLKLVRGILIALHDFHANGFIHCDLHPGNIALPVRETKVETDSVRGNYIKLEPVWNDIRIIDLDFSASRDIKPPIRLPHQLTEFGSATSPMSDHLRLRLLAIDNWLKTQTKQDRCYDREFWAKAPQSEQLNCFQTLDWREDIYQLGYWLAYIRDHWGGARHIDDTGGPTEVNRFIDSFPEELMEWGSANQINWDPVNLTSKVKAPTNLPHDSYISRIDSLLRQLGDEPKVMVLRHVDHDLQYEEAKRLDELAEQHINQRQYAEALPLYQRALVTYERVLGTDHPDVALALCRLAVNYFNLKQYALAEPLLNRALEIAAILFADQIELSQMLTFISLIYDTHEKYALAEPLYKRAIEIAEKILGPNHPDVGEILHSLARNYYKQKQFPLSVPLFKRALEIRKKALGQDHTDVAVTLSGLAANYSSQKQYALAEPLNKRALEIAEKNFGPDHIDLANSLFNLAANYEGQEKYALAEPLYKRALAILERIRGPDHPLVVEALLGIANSYRKTNRERDAKEFASRADAIRSIKH